MAFEIWLEIDHSRRGASERGVCVGGGVEQRSRSKRMKVMMIQTFEVLMEFDRELNMGVSGSIHTCDLLGVNYSLNNGF